MAHQLTFCGETLNASGKPLTRETAMDHIRCCDACRAIMAGDGSDLSTYRERRRHQQERANRYRAKALETGQEAS